ncbi:hypothetical protein ABPG72_021195 [Tetrahymena utriculariae]
MIQKNKSYNILQNFVDSNNSDTTDLYLDENGKEISEQRALDVSSTLSQCQNLISLELFFYQGNIGDQGVIYLATALSKITQIKKLEFSLLQNKFGDIGALEIASGLSQCLKISSLSIGIGSNNITHQGYLKLDQCLSGLPNLFTLYCYLRNGEKLLKSQEILNCKNIKVLTLSLECKKKEVVQHKLKALKIKRLVKFRIILC